MKKHPVYTTVMRRRDAICQDWAELVLRRHENRTLQLCRNHPLF